MRFEWNPEKNEKLKKERKILFEEIIFHLNEGSVWKIADHPKTEYLAGRSSSSLVSQRLELRPSPRGVKA